MDIGNIFVISLIVLYVLFFLAIFKERKGIYKRLKPYISKLDIIIFSISVLIYIFIGLFLVQPVEQLYFDENIYQGIALNILHNLNGEWCQYGTGYLYKCFSNAIYHDPIGEPFIIAIAFLFGGASINTAFNLQFIIGLLSLIAIAIVAILFTNKKYSFGIASLLFAIQPEIYIWARTQAIPDLTFMFFSILSMLFFLYNIERKTKYSLLAFLSILGITLYMRVESILLLFIYIILFILYDKNFFIELFDNDNYLPILILFIFLIAPEIYFIGYEYSNPTYGQGNSPLISFSYLLNFSYINFEYLNGYFDFVEYYPAIFSPTLFILALFGIFIAISSFNKKNLLIPGFIFIAYFLFYSVYYAGFATYGVDSRFMLSLVPSLILFSLPLFFADKTYSKNVFIASIVLLLLFAYVIYNNFRIYNTPIFSFVNISYTSLFPQIVFVIIMLILTLFIKDKKIYSASVLLLASIYFVFTIPTFSLKPSQMPQQAVIYNASQFEFNYQNYIPNNCLVFSFTPDIFFEYGKNAAQIGYFESHELTSNYSCYIFDYGYWCVVPPYNNLCSSYVSKYNMKLIIKYPTSQGPVAFYYILNYSNT